MQAIRCARAVTGRDVIVRFQGSYHGTSDPVTDFDKPGITNAEREAVIVLPQGDRSSLRELFDTSGTKIAAVLIDLMPNRAGLQPADPEFVNAVRQLTARDGSLMIVDVNRPRFYAHFLLREGWRDVDQVRREHQGQGGTAGP